MNPYIDIKIGEGQTKHTTRPVYQYDHGKKVRLSGLDTSQAIMIQFSFFGMTKVQTVPHEQENNFLIAPIPDAILMQDKDLVMYVYTEKGNSGKTIAEIRIPIIARPRPSGLYTPEQIDNYSAILAGLSEALDKAEDITERAKEAVPLAESWANATATAVKLDSDKKPTVVSGQDEDGNRTIEFGIPAGKNFCIIDFYPTFEELEASVLNPEHGDHYDVGPNADGYYRLYMFHSEKGWIDKGVMMGGGGTGDGTVISINDVEPDDEGNVALHLDNILPQNGEEETADGYIIMPIKAEDSDKLGGKEPSHYENKITSITANGQVVHPDANGAVNLGTIGRSNLEIDDTSASAEKVYSSQKTQYELNQLEQQMTSMAAEDLIMNGNFVNPVNLNGIPYGMENTNGQKINRWFYEANASDAAFGFVQNSHISITPPPQDDGYSQISQQFDDYNSMKGKRYTFATKIRYRGETKIAIAPFTMGNEPFGIPLSDDTTLRLYSVDYYSVLIRNYNWGHGQNECQFVWAALYEGEYTSETLPPYIPKGYANELLACSIEETGRVHDSDKLGGKPPEYYLQPVNLLDNSDFKNPVNQRGITETYRSGYTIDRWHFDKSTEAGTSCAFRVLDGCVELNVGKGELDFSQKIENHDAFVGKTCTIAVNIDGTIYVHSFPFGEQHTPLYFGDTQLKFYSVSFASALLRITADSDTRYNLYWAALYEGEYTAETIPPYMPKGYGAELVECMRYYYRSWDNDLDAHDLYAIVSGNPARTVSVSFPIPMRARPTVFNIHNPVTGTKDSVGDWVTDADVSVVVQFANSKHFMLAGDGLVDGKMYSLAYEVSADL